MVNIKSTFRSLFNAKQNNIIKIICLATGLAFGLILIAKVCFIDSYDSNIPDRERVYMIRTNYVTGESKDPKTYRQISGGVAPAMAENIPEVEAATRISMLNGSDGKIVTSGREILNASIYYADTCFFDVFNLPLISGNPKKIFDRYGHTMVSRSLAEKLGGIDKVVGMQFALEDDRNRHFVVDGVFEDLAENCTLKFDALTSIVPLGEASLNNWVGNDRYIGFARLRKGVSPKDMQTAMRKVQETHVDMEQLQRSGVDLWYTLTSLKDLVKEDIGSQNIRIMMLLLGMALIVISILNYLLIVVSTLVTRIREVSVNKCYGASALDITGMTFSEAAIHMVLSTVLNAGILLALRDKAETLLDASFSALFTPKTILILAAICIVLLAVTTFVPALLFNRIPVASAFRNSRESKRVWKLGLLAVQFIATIFIMGLLTTIIRQYNYMENADRGYEYENLLVIKAQGLPRSERERLIDELSRRPEVKMASSCFQLPFGASGNNIYEVGDDRELFNFADMYYITDNYFEVMGIPVVEGCGFVPGEDNNRKIVASRRFVERMQEVAGWTGSPIGREVIITEHSEDWQDAFTIIGVHENFRLGHMSSENMDNLRPTVFFYYGPDSFVEPENILVRLNIMSRESTGNINEWLSAEVPDKVLTAVPFSLYIASLLNTERNIRDAMLICSIVALIITLIGLIGYVTDEVNRRRREIAIRKVTGATSADIVKTIGRDITFLALPSLLAGTIISYLVSSSWIERYYSEHVNVGFALFLALLLLIFFLVLGCVFLRSWKAACANPSEALNKE